MKKVPASRAPVITASSLSRRGERARGELKGGREGENFGFPQTAAEKHGRCSGLCETTGGGRESGENFLMLRRRRPASRSHIFRLPKTLTRLSKIGGGEKKFPPPASFPLPNPPPPPAPSVLVGCFEKCYVVHPRFLMLRTTIYCVESYLFCTFSGRELFCQLRRKGSFSPSRQSWPEILFADPHMGITFLKGAE